MTLDLETLVVEYDRFGPTCVRLPDDPPGQSSLNPVLERVLLESVELAAMCEDQEAESELDFG